MTSQERVAIAALLAAEREQAVAGEAGLVSELAAIVEGSEQANLDDEHDPEGSTVGYERARVASLLEAVRRRSSQIEEAAARLHAGTYGSCERCHEPIAFERLSAHPTAVTCVDCLATSSRSPLRRR